jgi:hypothetical protein
MHIRFLFAYNWMHGRGTRFNNTNADERQNLLLLPLPPRAALSWQGTILQPV